MEYLDFYAGIRPVGEFSIALFDGGGRLDGKVSETWSELLARTVKCGNSYRRTIRSRLGVERGEHQELSASVKGTLGLPGVGSLESMIQGKLGTEVRFQASREWEDEYEFHSPKCGRQVVKLYQQQRLYDLSFEDSRPFRRKSWTKTVVSWLDRVHDGSKTVRFDPSCGCDEQENSVDEVGRFLAKLGSMSLLVEVTTDGNYAYLHPLKARIPLASIPTSEGGEVRVRLRREMVPAHLRFLSGDDSTDWEASLTALEKPTVAVEVGASARTMNYAT